MCRKYSPAKKRCSAKDHKKTEKTAKKTKTMTKISDQNQERPFSPSLCHLC